LVTPHSGSKAGENLFSDKGSALEGATVSILENWGTTQTHIDRRGLGYEMDHSFLAAPAWWMMQISAKVLNQNGNHQSIVRTGEKAQTLTIPPKAEGLGSGVNGGELLFLALATCYCNDVYREAKNRGLDVESVEVEIVGQFGSKGEPAENITYRVSVKAKGREKEVLDLMRYTDSVVEIHNTVRRLSYSPYVGLSKQSRQREAAHRVSSLSLPSLIRCSGALFQTVRTHT